MKTIAKKTIPLRVKRKILSIYDQYHRPEFIGIDPLITLQRYSDPVDVEIAGLIAAVLSYGRVETIIRSCEEVFRRMEWQPDSFLSNTNYIMKKKLLRGFKHRFNSGEDLALFLQAVSGIRTRYGSIQHFFLEKLNEPKTGMKEALTAFSATVSEYAEKISGKLPRLFTFLTPSPKNGGACKRLNMYLRWMIRPYDGIDRGVWKHITPSHLLIPVDTHIARVAGQFGLTSRRSQDWRMAEEITMNLKTIDYEDPVRFDFSLCRYGMLGVRKETA